MVLAERWGYPCLPSPVRWVVLLLMVNLVVGKPQQGHTYLEEEANEELIANIQNVEIKCATHEITVKIPTPHPHFNGMVYPQVSTPYNNLGYDLGP